jgi:enamine deaminase RidA (YjgF/YER057c/UK114 family)
MQHAIEQNLAALKLTLPEPPKPVAAYIPAVRTGNQIVVSGQLPFRNGQLTDTGRMPAAMSLEQAQAAAAQCVLNALAIVKAELGGDWSKLVRIVRIGVFVAGAPDYYEHPKVANGASELLVKLLGDAGKHARAAVGVSALPLNAVVEVEMLVEVR